MYCYPTKTTPKDILRNRLKESTSLLVSNYSGDSVLVDSYNVTNDTLTVTNPHNSIIEKKIINISILKDIDVDLLIDELLHEHE